MNLSRKKVRQEAFKPGMPEVKTVDTDRLMDWDFDKYNECCMKVWGNTGQCFDRRSLTEIEDFLSLYFDSEVVIYGMIMNKNAFNGYPYWTIYYSER